MSIVYYSLFLHNFSVNLYWRKILEKKWCDFKREIDIIFFIEIINLEKIMNLKIKYYIFTFLKMIKKREREREYPNLSKSHCSTIVIKGLSHLYGLKTLL